MQEAWYKKLRNSWRELTTECRRLGRKNCTIHGGSWQQVAGGLVEKNEQFLEGVSCGVASDKKCAIVGRLTC